MRVRFALAATLIALAASAPFAVRADSDQFPIIVYRPRTQVKIVCAAMMICDITLEPGERVHDGFAGMPDEWDAHATYSGDKSDPTPHLIFHPSKAGLHTNAVIPTSRRTYYLDLFSDGSTEAHYYTFSIPKVFIARDLAKMPASVATPAPPVDPLANCLRDVTYTYSFDRSLPADHPTGAVVNESPLSGQWQPRYICTDGRHTYVDFAPSETTPSDFPVLEDVDAEGDTQFNYAYDETKRRFRIDGVPDAFVIEFGSQHSPLRLLVRRVGTDGNTYDPAREGNK